MPDHQNGWKAATILFSIVVALVGIIWKTSVDRVAYVESAMTNRLIGIETEVARIAQIQRQALETRSMQIGRLDVRMEQCERRLDRLESRGR